MLMVSPLLLLPLQAISADNEFYAIWAALGFTRAPLYTGVTWKAQNQAAVLLAAGQKGHRCGGAWGTTA